MIVTDNPTINAALQLESLGIEHPANIAKALELIQTTFEVQPLDPPRIGELNTAAKVRNAIKAVAEHKAIEAQLKDARREIRTEIERDAAKEIHRNANEYIEQIREGFELAAAEYIENISKLPKDTFDAEDVAGFNEDQAVAYTRVKAAAATLKAAISVCREVNSVVGGFDEFTYSDVFYIVDPKHADGYAETQRVVGRYNSAPHAFKAIFPEIRDVIAAGAALHLTTPGETTEQVVAAESEYHRATDSTNSATDYREALIKARANTFNELSRMVQT